METCAVINIYSEKVKLIFISFDQICTFVNLHEFDVEIFASSCLYIIKNNACL